MNIFPDYKLIHNREGVVSSHSIFYFRTPSSVLGTVLTLMTKKEKKKASRFLRKESLITLQKCAFTENMQDLLDQPIHCNQKHHPPITALGKRLM